MLRNPITGTGAALSPYRRQLARTLLNLARLAESHDNPSRAAELRTQAVAEQEAARAANPENPEDLRLLESYKSGLPPAPADAPIRP